MKAICFDRYGPPDVLELREVDRPEPQEGEILVRVRAASVNPREWHFMRGTPYVLRAQAGLRRPKDNRLGIDMAGVVESVGRNVTRFRPGDEVFGSANGALAEYVAVGQDGAVLAKPANVTFEQAAAVPVAAYTALQALRDRGKVQPGQRVLVTGAGGGVGTFTAQLAKSFGAEVTGVCSGAKAELVRSIGADHVIDYAREDFTRGRQRYDLIVDIVGDHGLGDIRRTLTRTGTLVVVGAPDKGRWLGPLAGLGRMLVVAPFVSQRLLPMLAHDSREDLELLRGLMESGKLTPVVGRTYPLSETADAIRYLEEGHATGKIVVTV
jgi:NADPH:quinone reductase-like Zn-dependent oxidoreductase